MSEKVRKLKEDAARLIAKGKLADAADVYDRIVKADPKDLTARQKLAEIYARLGKAKDAVREYQSVAGSYAADGLLLKAIAVCKIILQVDPSHSETQTILAELSTKRRGESSAVQMPMAMSAALSGGKRSASDIRGVPSSQVRPKQPVPGADAAGRPSTDVPQMRPITQAPASQVIVPPAPPSADVAAPPKKPTLEIVVEESEDLAIEVTFDSSEGPPVVLGTSASQEGAATDLASVLPPKDVPTGDALAEALAAAVAGMPEELHSGASTELPSDEIALVEDDGQDVFDLEPSAAQVDVDKVPPIPLFSELPKEAFISLTERMELRVMGAGDVVMQEGERGASMFIIIQGRVSVSRTQADGDALVLAELTDGAFFGEMALLSDAPRTATVTAADDTMLFEISRELLNEITAQHPSVGEVMKRFHKNRLLTNLLKTSPIFAPFSSSDKKDLIEKFKSRSVNEGTYLITRERPGEGLYVLLSGRCEVLDTNDDGKEVFLAELKEGDVFGEMSMLWHKKTCASVRAVTPCVVLRLPRESFNEVIMTHPQILETLTTLSEQRQQRNTDLKAQPSADFVV
jgi:CRP-like cAMP-binding protein